MSLKKEEEDIVFNSKEQVILNRIKNEVHASQGFHDTRPLSLNQARWHGLATNVGRELEPCELPKGEKISYCACCARQIQKQPLPLSCDNLELSFLGSGYVAYLEFMKFCVALLLSFFLSSGLFNIITNSAFGDDCTPISQQNEEHKNLQCSLNWVTMFSLGNKRSRQSLMTSQSVFNLISIIVAIFLFQKYRYHLREIDQSCDDSDVTASDYTLLLSNVPSEFNYNGDIKSIDYKTILTDFLVKNLGKKQTVQKKNYGRVKRPKEEEQEEGDQGRKNSEESDQQNSSERERNNDKEKEREQENNQPLKINLQDNQFNGDSNKHSANQSNNRYYSKYAQEQEEIEIVSVGLCFYTHQFNQLGKSILKAKSKLEKVKDDKQKEKIVKNLETLKAAQQEIPKKYTPLKEGRYKIENFTGFIYVILQYEQDQIKVLDHYKPLGWMSKIFTGKDSNKLIFQGKEINVQAAPDPNNIFWENLHLKPHELAFRRMLLFLATLLVLGGCLGILFSFQIIQMKVGVEDFKDSPLVSVMSYLISISIILLNLAVSQLINYIAQKEARSTKAGFQDSVVVKHGIAQFLNTSVLLFIIQVFMYIDGDGYSKLFKAGGLAFNMNSIFMTQMVVQNAIQLVNVPYILNQSYKQAVSKLWKRQKSQKSLNSAYEKPIFDLQSQYSLLISSVFSALFYAPIIPFCIVWTLIQLIVKYFVDKNSILQRSSANVGANINLSLEMMEYLEFSLPIYSFANLLFFIYISSSNSVDQLSIFGFIIGVLHAILPMQILNEKLFTLTPEASNKLRYVDAYLDFFTDYDRENPILKEESLKKHYQALKQRAKVENKLELFISMNLYKDLSESANNTPIARNSVPESKLRQSMFGNIWNQQQKSNKIDSGDTPFSRGFQEQTEFTPKEEFKKEDDSLNGEGLTNKSSTFKNNLLLPQSGFAKLKKEILASQMKKRQSEGVNYIPDAEIIKALTGRISSNEIIDVQTPTTTATGTGSVPAAPAGEAQITQKPSEHKKQSNSKDSNHKFVSKYHDTKKKRALQSVDSNTFNIKTDKCFYDEDADADSVVIDFQSHDQTPKDNQESGNFEQREHDMQFSQKSG